VNSEGIVLVELYGIHFYLDTSIFSFKILLRPLFTFWRAWRATDLLPTEPIQVLMHYWYGFNYALGEELVIHTQAQERDGGAQGSQADSNENSMDFVAEVGMPVHINHNHTNTEAGIHAPTEIIHIGPGQPKNEQGKYYQNNQQQIPAGFRL